MATHHLKIWPQYFERVAIGQKPWELRMNDRDFQVGDTLYLEEYDPESKTFTDRWIKRRVEYILHGPAFGLESGYCIMSLSNE